MARKRSLPRRWVKIFLGLIALLVVLICLALLWLRSPWSEGTITRLLTNVLVSQGLRLEVSSLTGPLPERLLLKGVRISDDQGVFLEAEEMEIRIRLRQLISRTLFIQELRLARPVLTRLPTLAGSEAPLGEENESGYGTELNLPFAFHLESLSIEDGSIPWPLLGVYPEMAQFENAALEQAYLDTLADDIHIDAQGQVSCSEAECTGKLSSRFRSGPEFDLSIQIPGLSLDLQSTSHNSLQADAELFLDFAELEEQVRIALNAELEDRILRVDKLELTSRGLTASLEGDTDLAAGTLKASLSLQSRAEAPWHRLAADLGGLQPSLINALASPLSLEASLDGSWKEQLTLDLEVAQAGVLAGTGHAVIPMSSSSRNAPLEADLDLRISDLAPFGQGLQGSLKASLDLTGTLEKAELDFSLTSDHVSTAGGELEHLDATVKASILTEPGGGLQASGTIRLMATPDQVGETNVNARWSIDLPTKDQAGAEGRAELQDLRVHAYGLDLQGHLAAVLGPAFLEQARSPEGLPPGPESGSTVPAWPEGLSLDGQLSASVQDWTSLADLTGLPVRGENARLDLTFSSAKGQQAEGRLNVDTLRLAAQEDYLLTGVDADFKTDLANRVPAIQADLRMGRGRVSSFSWSTFSGRISGNESAGEFYALLLPEDTRPPNEVLAAAARIKSGSPAANPADAPLLDLKGSYTWDTMEITLGSLFFREPQSGISATLRQPARIALANGIVVNGLIMDFSPEGQLVAEASIVPGNLSVQADLSRFPTSLLAAAASGGLPPGWLDASVDITSSAGAPEGTLLAELRLDRQDGLISKQRTLGMATDVEADARDVTSVQETKASPETQALPDIRLAALVGRSSGRLSLSGSGSFPGLRENLGQPVQTGADRQAPLTFRIPLLLSADGLPLPDTRAPMEAALNWSGEVGGLWDLVAIPDRDLSGLVALDVAVSGSLADPAIDGHAYMAGGIYDDKVLGFLLEDITLEARADLKDGFRIVASASDGKGGTCGMEGDLTFTGTPALNARGQLHSLAPMHRDDLDLILTAVFRASGPLDTLFFSANALIERGEITLLSTMRAGSVTTLEISESAGEEEEIIVGGIGPTCEIQIEVPRKFYIRGRGLDSEWEGHLRVTGRLAEPELTGTLSPVRGYFELLSRPFAFTGGQIIFVGGQRINPGLNLEMTYTAPDLVAIVTAGGSLAKPTLDLQSRPPLPKDEVLAHVLFGKNVSDLSRFEALQLANSLRELAGIGDSGFNPISDVRKAVGLDVLRVGSTGDDQQSRTDSGLSGANNLTSGRNADSDDSSSPTLEAGKYINDRIYVGVEQGITQESTGVRVEVELFPNVTVQGKTTSQSSQAGIGWKMDY